MDVQVLGVLIAAEVGDDRRGTVAQFKLARHVLDDTEQPANQLRVFSGNGGQRPHVLLRHYDDVLLPEGLGVVEGQHPFVFVHNAK